MKQGLQAIILLMLLGCLAGCRGILSGGSASSGLQKAAAEYYNFRVGNSGRDYASFLSPAYRASFDKDGLAKLNQGNAPKRSGNARLEKVKPADVVVSTEANFAMTDVPPRLGFAFESMEPQRWVKSGGHWYLYIGSDREVSEYGYFPVGISFPQIPDELPAQVLDEKRRKDSPGGAAAEGEAKPGGG